MSFDYVVIGGGSSGCVVAAELSKIAKVVLLEEGDDARKHPETLVADRYKEAFINPALMHERFSQVDKAWGNRRLFMGSGRGLGGSGSINAMVYTRGAKEDFASWPQGWKWDDVVPVFETLEGQLHPNKRAPTDWTTRCIDSAVSAGFRHSTDLNDGDLSGVLGYEWMNYEGAERRSSFVAYLKPAMEAGQLTVITGARVEKLEFEGKRCVGVRYRTQNGVHVVRPNAEVILSAGALVTPAILQRSGLGPEGVLRQAGVRVVERLDGVGANLHDHPNVQLFFKGKHDVDCVYPQMYGFDRAKTDSDLPAGQADTCYVFYPARSSFREGLMRLAPAIALPAKLYDETPAAAWMSQGIDKMFKTRPVQNFVNQLWGIVVILGKPKSRGSVSIRSEAADVQAKIDIGYFRDKEDMDVLLDGVEKARQIAKQSPLADFGNRELAPGPLMRGRKALSLWARKNVMTTYHYAGTCQMGRGDGAVVCPDTLKVYGLDNVRVADASVMPWTPVSALNAPSMMIGLRAAQKIVQA